MKFTAFLAVLCVFYLTADQVSLVNKTDKTLYCAPYYKYGSEVTKCGHIEKLDPHSTVTCERPHYRSEATKFWTDRKLYITVSPEDLKDELFWQDRKGITSQKIGWLKGDTFYIAQANFRLKIFNALEWNILQPIFENGEQLIDSCIEIFQKAIKKVVPAIRLNKYKKQTAQVRVGNELCEQEKLFCMARKQIVKQALEKLLDVQLNDDKISTISIVASGGGFRAMLATIGFMHALESLGLLDAVTYISALSGSTWAIGSWLSSGLSVAEFKEMLLPELAPGLLPLSFNEVCLLVNPLLAKWSFDQPITMVDCYGTLVGNRVLKNFADNRHRIYLSDQAELLKDGLRPFPIYTAIDCAKPIAPDWFEFTPYEIGGAWLGHYVPSWAYGRKFKKGVSVDCAPEQSLSMEFGIFGSAFAATFNQMYNDVQDAIASDVIKVVIERILQDIGNKRISNSCFNNFAYGMNNCPIKTEKYIELADAGLDFNLPYPPISGERSERKSDIIIFLDASYYIEGVPALVGAAHYAHEQGLPFPDIVEPYEVAKRAVTVLKDDNNPDCPVVIYIPWVKNEISWQENKDNVEYEQFKTYLENFDPQACLDGVCDTFNFEYDYHQAQSVVALGAFNIRSHKNIILEAVKSVLD